MAKMTTEEAFVKVLQMHGIQHSFGIIGSAFMPISDLFPKAGITFWDVAHESNGGLIADGYTRSTGKIAMCIAQNGPGITGLVTPIKTAYWNHTPMLLVTPQAANKTMGQGGFQEVEQMNLFKDMVCYQEEVRDPSRMAEVLNRVILKAKRGSAPAQINVPRDFWTQVIDIELPSIIEFERPSGGATAIAEAASLLSNAKFPVILSGAGVVLADAIEALIAAVYLDSKLSTVKHLILKLWSSKLNNVGDIELDPKTALQHWVQEKKGGLPNYTDMKREGSDHNPIFYVEVKLENGLSAIGKDKSKRKAQQNAAQILIKELKI